ncbi:MAG: hypothetical protein J5701_00965 [Bacteroidales bacterium]|nr:hypothetical protein [Bacteroidales bacterium]
MKKLVFLFLFLQTVLNAQSQLAAPQLLQTKAEPYSLFLKWTASAGADGYEVIITGGKQQNYYVGNTEIHIIENIRPGCVYSVYIRAYAFENNAHSGQIQYWVLTPPSALPAKIIPQGFVAVWKRKLKVNRYRFEVSQDSNFTQTVSPYNDLYTSKKRFKAAPLPPGVYYYRLHTQDYRNRACYSNIIQVTVP